VQLKIYQEMEKYVIKEENEDLVAEQQLGSQCF
jgi:hypothetical protein